MLCLKCNTNQDGTHRFCKNCGNELEIHHKDPALDIVIVDTYEELQKKYKKNKRTAIGFILIFLVIILVLIAISLTPNKYNIEHIDDSTNSIIKPKTSFITPGLIKNIDLNIIGHDDFIIDTDVDEIELSMQTIIGANVTFNNKSVVIDEYGVGSIFLDKLSQGINEYDIKITSDGYAENFYTIIVKYQAQKKEIQLSIDSITVQDSKNGIMMIQGYTQKGIILTSNMDFHQPPTIVNGSYEALIQLPEAVKEYVVEIIATDKDGNTNVAKTVVEREYDEDEYHDNAIDINGSEFFENAIKYNSLVIKLSGKFKSVDKVSDELQIIDFVLSDTDDQSIKVYYYGESSLREGSTRTLYGQYMGEKDGKIVIHSYLAYKE